MKTKSTLFGVILALMTGSTWGIGDQLVPNFDLNAEIEAIEGRGTRDPGRRYINIPVVEGKKSLLAALRHDDSNLLPRKSFHNRDFFVIEQSIPEGLLQYLDQTPIFNKSTPQEFPEKESFWSVYFVEGRFVGERDGENVTFDGAYFAVKYCEVPKGTEEGR